MIGDAYVVAGGLIDVDKDITAIVNMAFEMRDHTAKVKSPSKDTALQVHATH